MAYTRLLSGINRNHNSFRRLSTSKSDIRDFKQWLLRFSGGCVTLSNESSDIASIKLSHENRVNAFSGTMLCELEDAISRLERNCPKGVVFFGANGNFSSGIDLSFVSQLNAEDAVKLSNFMQDLTSRITLLPAISVALLQGSTVGSGAELAMCADFRLAVPNSLVGFKHSHMGVTTGWGGGPRLVSVVGREAALRLLLSSEEITAEDAFHLRLVDHIIPGTPVQDGGGRVHVADPFGEAVQWLDRLVGKLPHYVVHSIKTLVQRSAFQVVQKGFGLEQSLLEATWGGEAHQNALNATRWVK